MVFPSSPEYLSLLRRVVEWFAKRCCFCRKTCARIVLSAVEASTNIIRHAYRNNPHQRITLHLTVLKHGLELEFLDRGRAVVPQRLASSAALRASGPAAAASLQPGGLGVRMIRSCMDRVHYEIRPEGGTRLVLRKCFDPESTGPESRRPTAPQPKNRRYSDRWPTEGGPEATRSKDCRPKAARRKYSRTRYGPQADRQEGDGDGPGAVPEQRRSEDKPPFHKHRRRRESDPRRPGRRRRGTKVAATSTERG